MEDDRDQDAQLSDDELVAGYRRGDNACFDLLLERYRIKLFQYILRQVGLPQEAEDLFQEVFFRVIENLKQYRPEGYFKAWLYRIAMNLCIDYQRRKGRRPTVSLQQKIHEGDDSLTIEESLSDGARLPREQAGAKEAQGLLAECIEKLSIEQKEVVCLRIYAGLSFREISQVVECPLNTVLARMQYALGHLRDELRGKGVFDEL